MLDVILRARDFAAEVIDRPMPALATTAGALGTAEVARTTHWAVALADTLAPYAAIVGYFVTFAIALWWARKWFRFIVGVFLSVRSLSVRCKGCERFSMKCAGCVREVLKPEGEE